MPGLSKVFHLIVMHLSNIRFCWHLIPDSLLYLKAFKIVLIFTFLALEGNRDRKVSSTNWIHSPNVKQLGSTKWKPVGVCHICGRAITAAFQGACEQEAECGAEAALKKCDTTTASKLSSSSCSERGKKKALPWKKKKWLQSNAILFSIEKHLLKSYF